jgi:hypothetical protein
MVMHRRSEQIVDDTNRNQHPKFVATLERTNASRPRAGRARAKTLYRFNDTRLHDQKSSPAPRTCRGSKRNGTHGTAGAHGTLDADELQSVRVSDTVTAAVLWQATCHVIRTVDHITNAARPFHDDIPHNDFNSSPKLQDRVVFLKAACESLQSEALSFLNRCVTWIEAAASHTTIPAQFKTALAIKLLCTQWCHSAAGEMLSVDVLKRVGLHLFFAAALQPANCHLLDVVPPLITIPSACVNDDVDGDATGTSTAACDHPKVSQGLWKQWRHDAALAFSKRVMLCAPQFTFYPNIRPPTEPQQSAADACRDIAALAQAARVYLASNSFDVMVRWLRAVAQIHEHWLEVKLSNVANSPLSSLGEITAAIGLRTLVLSHHDGQLARERRWWAAELGALLGLLLTTLTAGQDGTAASWFCVYSVGLADKTSEAEADALLAPKSLVSDAMRHLLWRCAPSITPLLVGQPPRQLFTAAIEGARTSAHARRLVRFVHGLFAAEPPELVDAFALAKSHCEAIVKIRQAAVDRRIDIDIVDAVLRIVLYRGVKSRCPSGLPCCVIDCNDAAAIRNVCDTVLLPAIDRSQMDGDDAHICFAAIAATQVPIACIPPSIRMYVFVGALSKLAEGRLDAKDCAALTAVLHAVIGNQLNSRVVRSTWSTVVAAIRRSQDGAHNTFPRWVRCVVGEDCPLAILARGIVRLTDVDLQAALLLGLVEIGESRSVGLSVQSSGPFVQATAESKLARLRMIETGDAQALPQSFKTIARQLRREERLVAIPADIEQWIATTLTDHPAHPLARCPQRVFDVAVSIVEAMVLKALDNMANDGNDETSFWSCFLPTLVFDAPQCFAATTWYLYTSRRWARAATWASIVARLLVVSPTFRKQVSSNLKSCVEHLALARLTAVAPGSAIAEVRSWSDAVGGLFLLAATGSIEADSVVTAEKIGTYLCYASLTNSFVAAGAFNAPFPTACAPARQSVALSATNNYTQAFNSTDGSMSSAAALVHNATLLLLTCDDKNCSWRRSPVHLHRLIRALLQVSDLELRLLLQPLATDCARCVHAGVLTPIALTVELDHLHHYFLIGDFFRHLETDELADPDAVTLLREMLTHRLPSEDAERLGYAIATCSSSIWRSAASRFLQPPQRRSRVPHSIDRLAIMSAVASSSDSQWYPRPSTELIAFLSAGTAPDDEPDTNGSWQITAQSRRRAGGTQRCGTAA